MKCPKCDLGVKPLPEVKSNGELVEIGGHVIDGMHCLTRQLAAKTAECEKLREKIASEHEHRSGHLTLVREAIRINEERDDRSIKTRSRLKLLREREAILSREVTELAAILNEKGGK